MRLYDLTEDAENDLREILRYTLKQWGAPQVRRYQQTLVRKLEAIAHGEVAVRRFSGNLPDVFVTKCEHHYIFYITQARPRPLVIAFFHERQDIVARLADRLGD